MKLPEVREWLNSHRAERNQDREANTYCLSGDEARVSVEGKSHTLFDRIPSDGEKLLRANPPSKDKRERKAWAVFDWKIQWLWQDYDFGSTIIQRVINEDHSLKREDGDEGIPRTYIDKKIAEFKANGFTQNEDSIALRKASGKQKL